MSVAYGGGAGSSGGAGYQVPGRVNFGWIGESFELFKANAGTWIVAGLALLLVPAAIGFVVGLVFGVANAAGSGGGTGGFGSSPLSNGLPLAVNALIQIVTAAYQAFMYGGIYHMAVKQVRGEPISASDIFSGGRYFLPMLLFTILYGIAIFVGILLLVVPGLLVVSLMIPTYAQIADGVSFPDAISRSIDGMKRDMWSGIAFMIVMGLIILVSLIPCGLGLFVTYPMLWIVSALAYRDMVGMAGPSTPYGAGYGAGAGVWPPPPNAAPGVWPPQPGAEAPPPQWGSPPAPPQEYPATPPQEYPATPPQQYSGLEAPQSYSGTETPQQYPPQQYPPQGEEPRRSLSGDPLDNPNPNNSGQNNPGPEPPGQGE